MSRYQTIRLPMEQEDGTLVIGDESNLPQLAVTVPYPDREQWGWGYWFVIRSESGKLVVYETPLKDGKGGVSLTIYDSFEEMQPHVPPNVYEHALLKAGLVKPVQYREVSLEGV
jgi:hypothetical protein